MMMKGKDKYVEAENARSMKRAGKSEADAVASAARMPSADAPDACPTCGTMTCPMCGQKKGAMEGSMGKGMGMGMGMNRPAPEV